MPDIFTLKDLTVEIPSQKENDPTIQKKKEEDEEDGE
jgi:hypothetical protein